jgi:predicted lipid-binding transport protein (Tim44 family)
MAVAATTLSFAPSDADAKRLGGGKAAGMQRQAPPANSTPNTPAQPNNAAPTAGAAPAAAGATAAAAGKRSWLGPIAGIAAGLGIAALFSHLGMGAGLANFMTMLLIAAAAFFVIRFLMRRFAAGKAQGSPAGMQIAGAGANGSAPANPWQAQPLQREAVSPATVPTSLAPTAAAAGGASVLSALPEGFDTAGFERVAKMLFIRMQAANDAGEVEDLRKFTTPELFASLRLDLQDRGGVAQKTDVVQLDAKLVDSAQENGQLVASVRFSGLIREESASGAEPFNELWHFVKPATGNGDWAIAGITPEA